ncbi:MAG: hypothetical protein K6T78_12760 [Alicyclobacillus sp.]|nr:hypothetical protein [Alicyclobacillus sp.]
MGKRTDRVFHVTVSALALTLLAVSLGTIAYQRHPDWIRRVLQSSPFASQTGGSAPRPPGGNRTAVNPSDKAPSGTQRPTNGSAPQGTHNATSRPTGGQTTASDIRMMPTYVESDNSRLISLRPAKDVSASQVARVQRVLHQYQIVHLDSQELQMNVYQEIYIDLAGTAADYQQQLRALGVSGNQASQFTLDTGGFTQADTIVVPLYQNTTDAELANTLAHELTHAILNLNVEQNFPSWMNEGLAVTDGMTAQAAVQGSVAYEGYAKQMAESVIEPAAKGTLWPLAADEQKVLSGTAPYDLELQDWLAVRDLLQQRGKQAFAAYFYRLNLGESEATAFQRSFGVSEQTFNATLTQQLKAAGSAQNTGVTVDFQVPANFHGVIRFLQHGQQNWTGFHPVAGDNRVHIGVDGSLSGVSDTTQPITDSDPPDPVTLYVNLDPDTPFTYQNQPVDNAGFAIDYHDGLYAFVNAWVTLSNGKSVYLDQPQLFGIQIRSITEDNADAWLLNLLPPPQH